jgi:hypothetical protein
VDLPLGADTAIGSGQRRSTTSSPTASRTSRCGTSLRNSGRATGCSTRGLLLDLLATGNRAGVDAAVEQWIELNAGML